MFQDPHLEKLSIKYRGALEHILRTQLPDGSIPWMQDGPFDPWNHVECAMALTVCGELEAAEKAYEFLSNTQLEDGSWLAEHGNALPMKDRTHIQRVAGPKLKDTNFSAYIATGIWHHYLVTNDIDFLKRYWPTVRRAMEFVVNQQSSSGEIKWCAEANPATSGEALISGCASIYKSLFDAERICIAVGDSAPAFSTARDSLRYAFEQRPDRFNLTWSKENRFAMDWYYPILTGMLPAPQRNERLLTSYYDFVVEDLGCRCVAEEPWVTVAESCELALALARSGEIVHAWALFKWQEQWCDEDGAFWMGYQYEEDIIWPEEKTTWTSAVVILTADALRPSTPTSRLFATQPKAAQNTILPPPSSEAP